MKHIELLENFNLGSIADGDENKEVRKVYDGARRWLLSIVLRGGEVLAKHKAAEPITVFCLAGRGTFRAGENLEDTLSLTAGTLLTLEAGILHEVEAEPEIHILVTRFKDI